jgi:hypothetical protein
MFDFFHASEVKNPGVRVMEIFWLGGNLLYFLYLNSITSMF